MNGGNHEDEIIVTVSNMKAIFLSPTYTAEINFSSLNFFARKANREFQASCIFTAATACLGITTTTPSLTILTGNDSGLTSSVF
jgi:hypothetical protein